MRPTEIDADDGLLWPWFAVATVALVGLLAVGAVLWRSGVRRLVVPASATSERATPPADGTQPLQVLADRLQARLRSNMADADTWALLARTHAASGQHQRAVPAFRHALALRPDDAALLADLAEALAQAQDRRLHGEPIALLQRALTLAPDHPKALSLAGREAYERRDWPLALRHWERLVSATGEHDLYVRQVRPSLEDARRQAASPR